MMMATGFRILHRKKIVFLFLLFAFTAYTSTAQKEDSTTMSIDTSAASFPKQRTEKRTNFRRAILELSAAEVLPWASNRFIRKAGFAKISLNSIRRNLNPASWEWDDNKFINNHISHHFYGSLFYNAFRSNGYDVWKSSAGAAAGAMVWELMMETHRPAPNDMVNTSLGGIALGEVTYRLSNALVGKAHAGLKGHLLETVSFLVNPINGLNRILDKKWNKPSREPRLPEDFFAQADLGSRQFVNKSNGSVRKWKNETYASLNLEYGSPFRNMTTPFHYFSAILEAGSLTQLNMVRVKAPLYGWQVKELERAHHIANLTLSYDFYKNVAFSYSAQSFHLNIVSDFSGSDLLKGRTSAGAGVIALAAVPNQYLFYGEGRNYDYGCGLGIAVATKLVIRDKFEHHLQYRRGWFQTVNGFQSSYFLGTTNSEIKYRIGKQYLLGFEWGSYFLNGRYTGYEDVKNRFTYVRFHLEHAFRL
jgi:hypothetical protein